MNIFTPEVFGILTGLLVMFLVVVCNDIRKTRKAMREAKEADSAVPQLTVVYVIKQGGQLVEIPVASWAAAQALANSLNLHTVRALTLCKGPTLNKCAIATLDNSGVWTRTK